MGKISEIGEIECAYGRGVAEIFRRIFVYERKFLIVCAIYFILMLTFIGLVQGYVSKDPTTAFIYSTIAGLGSNLLFLVAEYFIRRRK